MLRYGLHAGCWQGFRKFHSNEVLLTSSGFVGVRSVEVCNILTGGSRVFGRSWLIAPHYDG